MKNIGQAADASNDAIIRMSRDVGTLQNLIVNLEHLDQTARQYLEAFPEGGARAWDVVAREVHETHAALEDTHKEVAKLRADHQRGRDEAQALMHRAGARWYLPM
ncbi:hypothetical protein Ae201684P_006860 [Aphanomyces euteiches]|nr:hypothetical protein Ae201684P_006860 [Aphanomyces euteiches]